MLFKNLLILSILCSFIELITCGDDDDKGKVHEIKIEAEPLRIHTIHHHHIQKYTVIKKIEVPVIKEVRVPYKVYEIIKVPYNYYVKPLIVKVPIDYYHTKEEQHEHEMKHHEEKEDEALDHHE